MVPPCLDFRLQAPSHFPKRLQCISHVDPTFACSFHLSVKFEFIIYIFPCLNFRVQPSSQCQHRAQPSKYPFFDIFRECTLNCRSEKVSMPGFQYPTLPCVQLLGRGLNPHFQYVGKHKTILYAREVQIYTETHAAREHYMPKKKDPVSCF